MATQVPETWRDSPSSGPPTVRLWKSLAGETNGRSIPNPLRGVPLIGDTCPRRLQSLDARQRPGAGRPS